jgi:hypothetical protein
MDRFSRPTEHAYSDPDISGEYRFDEVGVRFERGMAIGCTVQVYVDNDEISGIDIETSALLPHGVWRSTWEPLTDNAGLLAVLLPEIEVRLLQRLENEHDVDGRWLWTNWRAKRSAPKSPKRSPEDGQWQPSPS